MAVFGMIIVSVIAFVFGLVMLVGSIAVSALSGDITKESVFLFLMFLLSEGSLYFWFPFELSVKAGL